MQWRIRLFGRLDVLGTGMKIEGFPTRRSAYLLARLAMSPRRELTRVECATILWPEDPFPATRLRLRQELARLRKTLGPASEAIQSGIDWIKLDMTRLTIDLAEYEELIAMAKEVSDRHRETLLLRAAQMGEATFMEGMDERWISRERKKLQRAQSSIYLELASIKLDRGDRSRALEMANTAAQLDPAGDGPARLLAALKELSVGDLGVSATQLCR